MNQLASHADRVTCGPCAGGGMVKGAYDKCRKQCGSASEVPIRTVIKLLRKTRAWTEPYLSGNTTPAGQYVPMSNCPSRALLAALT
jgi:hypothetical protein